MLGSIRPGSIHWIIPAFNESWYVIILHIKHEREKKIKYLCHFKFYIQKKTFHLTFCFPGQFNQLNFLLNEKTGSVLQWLVEGWRVKNLFERWMSRLAAFPSSSSFSLSWQESLGNCYWMSVFSQVKIDTLVFAQ